jgi:hypothetical protein
MRVSALTAIVLEGGRRSFMKTDKALLKSCPALACASANEMEQSLAKRLRYPVANTVARRANQAGVSSGD